jgi:hypothetical protein
MDLHGNGIWHKEILVGFIGSLMWVKQGMSHLGRPPSSLPLEAIVGSDLSCQPPVKRKIENGQNLEMNSKEKLTCKFRRWETCRSIKFAPWSEAQPTHGCSPRSIVPHYKNGCSATHWGQRFICEQNTPHFPQSQSKRGARSITLAMSTIVPGQWQYQPQGWTYLLRKQQQKAASTTTTTMAHGLALRHRNVIYAA